MEGFPGFRLIFNPYCYLNMITWIKYFFALTHLTSELLHRTWRSSGAICDRRCPLFLLSHFRDYGSCWREDPEGPGCNHHSQGDNYFLCHLQISCKTIPPGALRWWVGSTLTWTCAQWDGWGCTLPPPFARCLGSLQNQTGCSSALQPAGRIHPCERCNTWLFIYLKFLFWA